MNSELNDSMEEKIDDQEESFQKFDLHDSLGFLFRRSDSLARRLFYEHTAQSNISPIQFGVLLSIKKFGPISQSDLSNIIHIDPSTLGELVRRMADRNLIARRKTSTDGRKVIVALKPLGRRVLVDHFEAAIRMQKELLEPIPVENREIFVQCLKTILDSYNE